MSGRFIDKSVWASGIIIFLLCILIPGGGVAKSINSDLLPPATIPLTIECPADITVECRGDIPVVDIGSVSYSDTCGGNAVLSHVGDVSDGNLCPEIIERTYELVDSCGNVASCVQLIIISDSTPPILSDPSDITLDDCSIVQAFNDNTWLPYSEDEVLIQIGELHAEGSDAIDNCGISSIIYFDQTIRTYCPIIVLRTFNVTDACGNISTVDYSIIIEDTYPPEFQDFPEDTITHCDDIPEPPKVRAKDNCSCAAFVYFTELSNTVEACEGTIVREFRAEDDCGNYVSKTQTITVIPLTTGIENIASESALKIYPNPGKGVFNLEFLTPDSKDIDLSVRDISGKLVFWDSYSAADNSKQSIDISNKPPGLYFLHLTTDSGVYTRRIVIW